MKQLSTFYDRYHQKNHRFSKIIREGNFTYWYTLEFLHQACTKGFAGLKVLDIGSGVGAISLYLAAQGAKVTGIDISPRAVEIAQHAQQEVGLKNVTFINGELTAEPKKYDVITCFEVIEHIKAEQKFIKLLFQNLKPGGVLVLSTPSRDNWLYKLGYFRRFDQEVGHVRRYSESELRQKLTEVGFTVQALRSKEGPIRMILFTSPLGFLIKGIKGPLVPLFHTIDEIFGRLFGFCDIQVIAKK